jgi:hypothetical protein
LLSAHLWALVMVVVIVAGGVDVHRKLTGYGDIVHCSYYIEHKAGHLVKVAARIQFFFDTTTQVRPVPAAHQGPSLFRNLFVSFVHFSFRFVSFLVLFFVSYFVSFRFVQINYSVWCIDEVLGSEMPSVPFKGKRPAQTTQNLGFRSMVELTWLLLLVCV